jgi:hypothetical protein
MTEPATSEKHLDPTPVTELMKLMVRCQRAIMLYMPNNPIYQEAATHFQSALGELWTQMDELLLRVRDNGFTWQGEVVLEEPNQGDSMGWALFKDGVMAVKITPGAEEEELMRFLRIIHQARTLPDDAQDDARTLLWAADLQTIKCDYTVVGSEGTRAMERSDCFVVSPTPLTVKRELALDIKPVEGIAKTVVGIEEFDSSLYFLDDEEIRYLNSEIQREYDQDLRRNVLSMLCDAIELEDDDVDQAEIVTILDEFFRYLLGAGDLPAVAYIIREARTMADRFPNHRDRLATFAADLSEPDTLDQLLKTITESEVAIADQDLSELFGQFQPQAMETALSWLPRPKPEQARRLLARATDHLAAAHPEAVSQALESEDRTVVVGALRLVSGLKLKTAGPKLEKFVMDPDKDVRLALVDALASLATPSSLTQLEQLLEDSDRDVRIRAVTELSIRHRRALSQVEAAVLGKAMRSADLTEKRAFFEAYGLLSGGGGIARLRSLLRRGWFKRKVDAETRACAAMALGKIANTDALDVLERAQGDKEPIVRVAVSEALGKRKS